MKTLVKGQKYIEYCIFAGVFLILCFFLARYTVYTLDSDASSELLLAKHLADCSRRTGSTAPSCGCSTAS